MHIYTNTITVLKMSFTFHVHAACNPRQHLDGPMSSYTADEGYYINESPQSEENPYGQTYHEGNFYGTGRQLNLPIFTDPVRSSDDRGPPHHRTISVNAHISANTGPFGGGGAVDYTFKGYTAKLKNQVL